MDILKEWYGEYRLTQVRKVNSEKTGSQLQMQL